MGERYALTGETLEALGFHGFDAARSKVTPWDLAWALPGGRDHAYVLSAVDAHRVLRRLVKPLTGAELADEVQVWCFPVPMVGPPRSTRWSASFPGQAATQWLPGTDGASTWLEAVGRAAVTLASWRDRMGDKPYDPLRTIGGSGWEPFHLLVSRDGGPWEPSCSP